MALGGRVEARMVWLWEGGEERTLSSRPAIVGEMPMVTQRDTETTLRKDADRRSHTYTLYR